ncbi:hypothetical protein CKO31_14335 [Thiohalocapsa halophila]|uniref:PEP-CTERM sorting domain-containing protein n=1 Tax=Thiohalocapsa halophila TaxID=69359 RepID=A0ABS1CJ25_9GAMM|nr:autotransporter-associated beta strand repeat-containing protein [Thiohalocapsa halophila]MBK1631892.1 hypothetical protein [Thiohalocapsa halophila]
MQTRKSFRPAARTASSLIGLMVALGSSNALAIAMDGSDPPNGVYSFNESGNWEDDTAPVPGQSYETLSFRINTPPGTGDFTFAGDQLTVNGGLFVFKGSGIVTVNSVGGSDGLVLSDGATVVGGQSGLRSTLSGLVTLEQTSTINAADPGRGIDFNSSITGSGGMTLVSTAGDSGEIVLLNPNNDYSGATTLQTTPNAGGDRGVILRAGAPGALSPNSDIIVTAGSTVELDGNDNTIAGLAGDGTVENASATAAELTIQGGTNNSFSGSLQDGTGGGALSVRKTEDTRQIFSGTGFSYTGGTTIEDGQLRLAAGASLGAGAVTITGDGSGTVELDNTDINYAVTLEGRGSDTAHIDNIAGNNTVSGPLTLQETADSNDPAIFTIDSSGGDLDVSSDLAFTGTEASILNLGGASTGTVTGNINLAGGGSNALEKEDGGTWTLAGTTNTDTVTVNAGQLNIADTLTTSGDVTVTSGGTLQQQAGSQFDRADQGGKFIVDGSLDLNGNDASISALDGASTGVVDNTGPAAVTLTLGNSTPTAGSFAGTIQDTGTGASVNIVKDGSNTQTFSGANTYTGSTEVQAGALNIQNDDALGTTDGDTTVSGSGRVQLEGGITVGEAFDLIARSNMGVHLENVSNSNTISGAVTLEDDSGSTTDDNYTISSTSGMLDLDGGITSSLATGNRILDLGGSGDGTVAALTFDEVGNQLVKSGDGTWTVSDATMTDGTITSEQGVLALAGDASNLDGSMVYEVLSDAELDVTGITSPTTGTLDLDSGQQLKGNGLVDGNVVAASGSELTPDDFGTVGELEISGDLNLDGTLQIDIAGTMIDKLIVGVGSDLDISDAFVEFSLAGRLNRDVAAYVFAQYGTLSGSPLGVDDFTAPDALTTFYDLDYDFGNNGQIAWVRNDVPAPAPLALIGIGALLWGGLQLRAKRRAA